MAIEQARETEQFAKQERNALTVARYPRSGDRLIARTGWAHYEWWTRTIGAFRQGLPHSLPYDWRSLTREYRGIELAGDVLRQEAMRVYLQKARDAVSGFELPASIQTVDHLEECCNLLLIARFLAGYPEEAEQ